MHIYTFIFKIIKSYIALKCNVINCILEMSAVNDVTDGIADRPILLTEFPFSNSERMLFI